MMNRVIFLLLMFFAIPACSSCIIEDGHYQNSGGGEYAVFLKLSKEGSFLLEHETWRPGEYENREKSRVEGSWSCSRDQITLKTQSYEYIAELTPVGNNPLGISEKTVVLVFLADPQSKVSFLSNEILYPEAAVSD